MSIQIVEKEVDSVGSPQPGDLPPLESGDRLSRVEFEQRYHAHPHIKKAELIEGVAYVASPIRHKQHSKPHGRVAGWLYTYHAATPGTDMGDNGTVRLDDENEVQPDVFVRLEPDYGGASILAGDDYIEGPPEFIIEIAASSAGYDLHDKKAVYARTGVREYVVIQMYERRVDWFILRGGEYEPLPPDDDAVFRSEVFPGLWLHPSAIWSDDPAEILTLLQTGVASAEHKDFVTRLQHVKGDS